MKTTTSELEELLIDAGSVAAFLAVQFHHDVPVRHIQGALVDQDAVPLAPAEAMCADNQMVATWSVVATPATDEQGLAGKLGGTDEGEIVQVQIGVVLADCLLK